MRIDVIISRLLASLLLAVMLTSASCWLDKPDEPRPKTVIELDSGWQFREAGSEGEWLPATVPGTVHTDLLAAGKIPDPFYGDNEKDLQWIGEKEHQRIKDGPAAGVWIRQERVNRKPPDDTGDK